MIGDLKGPGIPRGRSLKVKNPKASKVSKKSAARPKSQSFIVFDSNAQRPSHESVLEGVKALAALHRAKAEELDNISSRIEALE